MLVRVRSMACIAMTALAAVAITSTAALAQYPPAQDFGVSCTFAGAGESVTCSVVGAGEGETLTASASVDDIEFYSEVLSATAAGEAAFGFTVPDGTAGQRLVVAVAGEVSGTATDGVTIGTSAEAGQDDEGEAVADESRLPRTGQDLLMLGGIAAFLLLGGSLVLRRRRADASERVDA